MNWSVAKIGTIYQKPAHTIGLSTPPIGCVLDLAGLPGGGNKMYDRSPYGNIGTITGAAWVRTPGGLWCLDFDGADDYVTIPDDPSLDITTTLTALVWVNTSDVSTTRVSLSKYKVTGGNREWQIDRESADGEVCVYFGDPADGSYEGREVTDTAYYVNNTWLLTGFTFNAGTVVIYINGVAVASSTLGTIPASLYNGTSDVGVGSDGDLGALWKGKLALPRIYNRALSALEIQNHYQQEKHLFGVC